MSVRFGRYTDADKTAAQLAAWTKALAAFEAKDFLVAFAHFFAYLADETLPNVKFWQAGEQLHFELYQGSKQILGVADAARITATVRVVHCQNLPVSFMRRILERNATLLYTAFGLDDNNDLCLRFWSYTADCTPQKLYFALKELGLTADKEDDLLLQLFAELRPIANAHITPLPAAEQQTKYAFLQKWLTQTKVDIAALNPQRYAGGMAYLYLDLVYRIDYLLAPEGMTMEVCDRAHAAYFDGTTQAATTKLPLLQKAIDPLFRLSANDFAAELYRTTTTFGIAKTTEIAQIQGFVREQLPTLRYFMEVRQLKLAAATVGFIVGFCFFSYVIPAHLRRLFGLWYAIAHNDYYAALGFSHDYYTPDAAAFSPAQWQNINAALFDLQQAYPAQFAALPWADDAPAPENLAALGYALLQKIGAAVI